VPEEDIYHLEFALLIRDWFYGVGWMLDTEFITNSKKSADLVITSPSKQRYVLELVAHERDGPATRSGSVEEHFVRVENCYSKIQGVVELWVINFTTRKPSNGYVWPSSKSVNAIHVYHTLDWKKASVSFSKHETVEVKLS